MWIFWVRSIPWIRSKTRSRNETADKNSNVNDPPEAQEVNKIERNDEGDEKTYCRKICHGTASVSHWYLHKSTEHNCLRWCTQLENYLTLLSGFSAIHEQSFRRGFRPWTFSGIQQQPLSYYISVLCRKMNSTDHCIKLYDDVNFNTEMKIVLPAANTCKWKRIAVILFSRINYWSFRHCKTQQPAHVLVYLVFKLTNLNT